MARHAACRPCYTATVITFTLLAITTVAAGNNTIPANGPGGCDADVPPCSPESVCVPTSDGGHTCVCAPEFPGDTSANGKGCIRPTISAETSDGRKGLEVRLGTGSDLYVTAGIGAATQRTSVLSLATGLQRLLGDDLTGAAGQVGWEACALARPLPFCSFYPLMSEWPVAGRNPSPALG